MARRFVSKCRAYLSKSIARVVCSGRTQPERRESALPSQIGNAIGPNRMSGRQQQTALRITLEHPCMGAENRFVLSRMRAGRDPHRRPSQPQSLPKSRRLRSMILGQDGIELDIAERSPSLSGQPERIEPFQVVPVLAGYRIDLPQHAACQVANPEVTPRGPPRQARIDEQYGNTPTVCLVDQIRPQLGFHQHQQSRPHPVEEGTHRKLEVVRRIAVVHGAPEALADLCGTGRRRGSDQERRAVIIREFLRKLRDQRRHGDGLARGNGMKPDAARRYGRRRLPQPLADALSVFRFPARPPLQPKSARRGGSARAESGREAGSWTEDEVHTWKTSFPMCADHAKDVLKPP